MDFCEFVEMVEKGIKSFLPEAFNDASVRVNRIEKNNDTNYTAISVTKKGGNISPAVHLEPFYQKMINENVPADNVIAGIADVFINMEKDSFDCNSITVFENAKARIFPKVVNKKMNEDRLKNLAYTDFADDLAVIYAVDVSNHINGANVNGVASTPVTNALLKEYGITVAELDMIARKNISGKSEFMSYCDVMKEMIDEMRKNGVPEFLIPAMPIAVAPMYILSNKERVNGANALLDTEMTESIAEHLGGDYVIIPSSIHEVIIVPADECLDADSLENMIGDVNNAELQPDEYLSTHAYIYNAKTKSISSMAA